MVQVCINQVHLHYLGDLLHDIQMQGDIRKKWNGAFHFHNFNLKLHRTSVFTPVYISFCARMPVANTPFHLAKHTPKIQPQKIKKKKNQHIDVDAI